MSRVCQVHDADDNVPGRICGRPMPCRDHGAVGPRSHITKIDLAGLRVALTVLRKHEELLRGSAVDLGGEEFGPSVARTCMALGHVLEDGYRDRGTRGSS